MIVISRYRFGVSLCVFSLAATLPCSAAPDYPPARRDAALDDYNGVKVADPYRWMEQLDSPETRQWVEAEAHLTDSYLEKIPVREQLHRRITALRDFEKFGVPFRKGNRYFYYYNSGLQQQSVLYVTDGLDGKPTVAFDPNLLSTNGAVAIAGYVVSPNGKTLAYGVSQGGSDWTDWRFRDLDSGRDLPDVVKWTKYYHPVFSTNGGGVYYSAFPSPAKGDELRAKDLGNAVFFHRLGTPETSDRKLLDRPDHPDWQFEPHLTSDGHWLVIRAGEGEVGDKGLENLYAINLKADGATAIPLAEGFDADYIYSGADQGLVYFQTTLDAPRGRVIAIDPSSPARAHWKEIIPQTTDALDVARGSVSLVDHQLIVRALHDAASSVKIYDEDCRLRREVALPGRGTVGGFDGEASDREAFYTYTDLATPPTIFRIDLETGESKAYRSPKIAFDTSVLETRQIFYPAKDGTKIPMSLVYKKGIKLDGSNPTILYGYGGFGISILPSFDPTRLAWLERGGIYAQANIRGGGEYGDEWHRQAIRAHKQIVFDDFISAAEWLIARGYTSTPKLAIQGGSNGGLLVGACVTQRPDLFGAALAYVGVMDMLRFDQFGQGAGWVGDYGTPRDPDDFKILRAYSPYHNVREGAHYPATLVITGDHDARVMPAHSFKFAAALQHAQSGPAPVLLKVRLSTGHGAGPTTSQVIEEKADAYAFLIRNLGMDVNP